jgi:hypothetical protein
VYNFLANAVVGFHFLFILFVVCGGGLVIRYPRIAFLHLPAAIWGAVVEFSGWICPLTPLENHFRNLAGETSYSGDFIQRYLIPVMYPENLTPKIQLVLGSIVIVVNVVFYVVAVRKYRQRVRRYTH